MGLVAHLILSLPAKVDAEAFTDFFVSTRALRAEMMKRLRKLVERFAASEGF
jgi:hypothetical protein